MDGANSEGWMNRDVEPEGGWGWRSRVELIRNAAAAGKRTNLLAPAAGTPSAAEALFTFASYLMAYRDDRNTFWYGQTYRAGQMTWYGFYDADLGAPTADIEEIAASGVFTRRFERGLVLVNPGNEAQRVPLPGEWLDESGQALSEMTLGSKEARILLAGEGP